MPIGNPSEAAYKSNRYSFGEPTLRNSFSISTHGLLLVYPSSSTTLAKQFGALDTVCITKTLSSAGTIQPLYTNSKRGRLTKSFNYCLLVILTELQANSYGLVKRGDSDIYKSEH